MNWLQSNKSIHLNVCKHLMQHDFIHVFKSRPAQTTAKASDFFFFNLLIISNITRRFLDFSDYWAIKLYQIKILKWVKFALFKKEYLSQRQSCLYYVYDTVKLRQIAKTWFAEYIDK